MQKQASGQDGKHRSCLILFPNISIHPGYDFIYVIAQLLKF